MSKMIRPDVAGIEKILENIKNELATYRMSDGKLKYEVNFGDTGKKTTLYFTLNAWYKMFYLVQTHTGEVGWHGVAHKLDDNEGFVVEDILVYPQQVSGTTVNTDQVEYQTWLMSQEDDVFNNIRFQGHSHVNMGVTPSSVDNTLYEGILSSLREDAFYIFLIMNKKENVWVNIYDMAENVLYESSDITLEMWEIEDNFAGFYESIEKNVTSKYKYGTSKTSTSTNTTTNYYGGYYAGSQPVTKKEEPKFKQSKEKPKVKINNSREYDSIWEQYDDEWEKAASNGYDGSINDYIAWQTQAEEDAKKLASEK